MTTQLSPLPVQRFFDNNNNPLSGGRLWTYAAGTSTPQSTYTDSTGGTPNANPIILNARGEANVWLTPGQAYKFVLQDASLNTIWTVDQVSTPITTTYLAPATGSVSRTITSKLSDFLSVKDFGAVGDGVTDDTVAIQTATTWAGALGRAVYFPAATYIYSGISVASANQISFIGESTSTTILQLSSGTAIGFNCATDLPVIFDSLTFAYKGGVTGTAGSFISVPGGTVGNFYSQFRNLQMNAPFVGFSLTGAENWSMERVYVGAYISTAVIVADTFHPDHGDSSIEKCLFTTTSTTATGVLHRSSGGLRIINTKCIGGSVFYQLLLDTGATTADLLITGCSIEGQSSASIAMRRNGASGTFGNIAITGNQFAGSPIAITCNDSTAGWLANIAVTGNSGRTTGGTCINFSVGDSITIDGNAFTGAGTGDTGISLAAAVTNGRIGVNCLTAYTTPISNASNSSSVAKKVYQTTTGNITCSTTYGSLFSGNASVSFPSGLFLNSPIVTATAISGTSAVSAVVSGVSGTGCTVSAICGTSGSLVNVYVRAEADY